MPNLLQLAWMLGSALATVLLPATNERLPCSTRPWVIALVLAGFGLWVIDRLILNRGGFQSTRSWWWMAVCVPLYGWLIALVPSAMVDEVSSTLFTLDMEWWKAFGTVDAKRSTAAMSLVSITMMLLLMTADMTRDRFGRYWMAAAVSIAGTITAVAGLWTQTNVDRVNLWQVTHVPNSVFGLFWYHGNAASFLNLVWPVTAWLSLSAIRARLRPAMKHGLVSVLGGSLVLQIVAVFVNVSKMGHALVLMQLLMLAVALQLVLWRHQAVVEHAWKRWTLIVLSICGLLGVCAWLLGGNQGLSRWQSFSMRGFDDPARRHAASMAVRMGNDAAWTGTGPGTFEVMSPHYAALDAVTAPGWWKHAHNDYAQFYAEWGWIGCVVLLIGLWSPMRALMRSWRVALSHEAPSLMSAHRRGGVACLSVSLLSVLLHALVDFPFQIMALQNTAMVLAGMLVSFSVSSTKHRQGMPKR